VLVVVISNAASAIYASGGRSCVSHPSAAVPLVVLPGIYLSTWARGILRPMDACCVLCVNARVYMRDSAVISPRYWWCVALFIAASPLSRRRGLLHTNRPLARKRRNSLSLSSLSPVKRKGGWGRRRRRTLVYARERPVRALCRRVLRGRNETYVSTEHQRIFYDPGTPGIKTARRLKNRLTNVDRKDDAVLSRERWGRFFFYVHLTRCYLVEVLKIEKR